MCTEVMIISAAMDFGSELGVALAQRGAYRVSLVHDGATALARVQQGLVLLDSLDEEAGRALVQQLQETKPGLAVHFTPQAAGVEAALEQLQPAEDTLDAAPLEPLAGDESDASSWRFVREPEFLRGLCRPRRPLSLTLERKSRCRMKRLSACLPCQQKLATTVRKRRRRPT